ncbi:PREDICTED: uncharacterized protein LOC106116257 [Papilio xuthus]|uniref:Uncharacterized protein LOC106116257 n=1 Tax=Papilio xuthus TaxID=66420 RepID=A0AAJ6Z561_PAPXU|nr:PREDICTED: uncharacterized protein LOC106116257 [Papilio xuthus]
MDVLKRIMKKYTNYIFLCLLLVLDFLTYVRLETTEPMVEFWTIPAQLETFPIESSVSQCATELMECYSMTIFKIAVCAVNSQTGQGSRASKKSFPTFCDMHYRNCKSDVETWHYLKDDDGSGKC